MRTPRLLAVAALICALPLAATAQVHIAVIVEQPLSAAASSGAPRAVPAGSSFVASAMSPQSLSATSSSTPAFPACSFSVSSGVHAGGFAGGQHEVLAFGGSSASGQICFSSSGGPFSGQVLATFSSAIPTQGFFRVEIGPRRFINQPPFSFATSISAFVDIGADGVNEATTLIPGPTPRTDGVLWLPATLDAAGVPVRIGWSGATTGSARVEFFEAGTGQVVVAEPSCGPGLNAVWVRPTGGGPDQLRIAFFDLHTTPFGATGEFLVFGTTDPMLTLPGSTGCALRTDILGAFFFPDLLSNIDTHPTLSVPIPPGLSGLDFRVQGLIGAMNFNGIEWRTTDTLRVLRP
ncbi:MAG: hypothetical protein AAF196_17295 [Planctomycetota bacterium]